MEDRDGFVKDSKVAIVGTLNGIFGSTIYQYILLFLFSFVISFVIGIKNPNADASQLETLISDAYNSLPIGILLTCLSSLATLIVFIVIIRLDEIKLLIKKMWNMKTLKYGVIVALCLMGFSIFYNNIAMAIFDLDSAGNANQDTVTQLIHSNAILSFLAVVILAPIVEELTFRYCLFGELNKRNKILAYVISGGIFMLMHSIASFTEAGGFNSAFVSELVYLPPYLFSGLVLCYIYDKTGNLGTSIMAHLLNNLVSFLLVVLI